MWCPFSESRRVPDAVIDRLAGNGIADAANKGVARELVRTAVRNFDALHFQAILDDRWPTAYQMAVRKSKPRLKKKSLCRPVAAPNNCANCHRAIPTS